jgi:acyl carrier protein phosphodiesterase
MPLPAVDRPHLPELHRQRRCQSHGKGRLSANVVCGDDRKLYDEEYSRQVRMCSTGNMLTDWGPHTAI